VSFDIINPSPLGQPSGWNHGMLGPAGGRVLFVAGQTAAGAGGIVEQWERALERVVSVVRAAGGAPEDIGRMRVFVTDRAAYLAARRALGEVHLRHMGKHYPAMALVEVKALVDEGAVVEIEATAVIP
jgi:enamine deaminase RidA (YjgF/YER057c/UK114 family)